MSERESPTDLSERSKRGVDIDRIRTVIDRYPVRLAVLFGSQVTGVADASSDVDSPWSSRRPSTTPARRSSLLAELSVALDRNDVDLSLVDDPDPRVGRARDVTDVGPARPRARRGDGREGGVRRGVSRMSHVSPANGKSG
ncbi:hypothetical protein [Halosimplex halobium]|uniref:hypothetical protein n=1 Tax=Halosimplex halobium TaxID=3396618 RepID=UPI003F55823B